MMRSYSNKLTEGSALKKKRSPLKIIVFFVFIVLAAVIWLKYKDNKQIRDEHFVTKAEISAVNYNNGGWFIDYQFNCHDKLISGYISCSQTTKDKFSAGEHSVFVVVDKNDCNKFNLLETKADFKKYDIEAADTLQ